MRGFLFAIGVFCVALPGAAEAYCVMNNAKNTLRVKLDVYNPLGSWYRTVAPGTQVCCDWFDHTCNPGTSRDAILYLRITARYGKPRYCSHNARKQVKATGEGRIVVEEDTLAAGGLRCKSTDRLLREITAPGYRPLGKQRPRFVIPKSVKEQEIDARNRTSTEVPGVTPAGEAKPPPAPDGVKVRN